MPLFAIWIRNLRLLASNATACRGFRFRHFDKDTMKNSKGEPVVLRSLSCSMLLISTTPVVFPKVSFLLEMIVELFSFLVFFADSFSLAMDFPGELPLF